MSQIKLIQEDTDIKTLDMKRYNWDAWIGNRPLYVVRIEGYIHSIGGKRGENDLWCYPRNEEPSVYNLVPFSGEGVCWGINISETNHLKDSWTGREVRNSIWTVITRNGEEFYSFSANDFGYAMSKARVYISEFDEHPIDIAEIGFAKKVVGRKVWWRESPAIVTRFIEGQACVMLSPDGIDEFHRPNCYGDDDFYYEESDIKADILDKHIYWFRN